MAFALDRIVPWGRSFDEYTAMFDLSPADLEKQFLGCGDGPASFNCILTRRGGSIVSTDPLYHFSRDEIKKRIDKTYAEVMQQTGTNRNEFVWKNISSVEELGRIRMAAMDEFLADYTTGQEEKRYVEASLPVLPFKDREFDIALCSHFLFLYSGQLSEDFHLESVKELCRVACEARIFPLLELGSKISRHLDKILGRLRKEGYDCRVEKVAYEFQKGGNEMLKVMTTWHD